MSHWQASTGSLVFLLSACFCLWAPSEAGTAACLAEEACRSVAQQQSLILGYSDWGVVHPFAGDYSSIGCFAYRSGFFAGHAFYGLTPGGSAVQDEAQLDDISKDKGNRGEKYRLDGTHVCSTTTVTTSVSMTVSMTVSMSSTTATVTTALQPSVSQILGSFTLTVNDPETFAQDPLIVAAVTSSVASQAGVPSSWVTVEFRLVPARRLSDATWPGSGLDAHEIAEGDRRLQSGMVVEVVYVITVPPSGSVDASAAYDAMSGADATSMTTSITQTISQTYGPGVYTVTVADISAPTLEIISIVENTTTASFVAPNLGERPQALAAGALIAIIVIAFVFGLVFCVVLGGLWMRRGHAPSKDPEGALLLDDDSDTMMGKSSGSRWPPCIEISGVNDQTDGIYRQTHSKMVNDCPVWVSDDSRRVIYSLEAGMWGLMGMSAKWGKNQHHYCTRVHNGSSPHRCSWGSVKNGKWAQVKEMLCEPVWDPPPLPDPKISNIWVTIVSCDGLVPDLDTRGMDMYCVCQIPGKPGSIVATKVVRGQSDRAVWNYQAGIAGYTLGDSLDFIVYRMFEGAVGSTENRYSDVLGEARLDAEHFDECGFDGELRLKQASVVDLPAWLRIRVSASEEEDERDVVNLGALDTEDSKEHCRFVWTIPSASLKHAQKGQALDSQDFKLEGAPCSFRVRFFPQGFSTAPRDHCSLYLRADASLEMQVRLSLNGVAKVIGPEMWRRLKWRGHHPFWPAMESATTVDILVELLSVKMNGRFYTPRSLPLAALCDSELPDVIHRMPAAEMWSRTEAEEVIGAAESASGIDVDGTNSGKSSGTVDIDDAVLQSKETALGITFETDAREAETQRQLALSISSPVDDEKIETHPDADAMSEASVSSLDSMCSEAAGVLREVVMHEDQLGANSSILVDGDETLTHIPAMSAEPEISLEIKVTHTDEALVPRRDSTTMSSPVNAVVIPRHDSMMPSPARPHLEASSNMLISPRTPSRNEPPGSPRSPRSDWDV